MDEVDQVKGIGGIWTALELATIATVDQQTQVQAVYVLPDGLSACLHSAPDIRHSLQSASFPPDDTIAGRALLIPAQAPLHQRQGTALGKEGNMEERLQKILAQAGYGSRRHCEEFITTGRVHVNGRMATIGEKADPAHDKITLDGKPIAAREALTYIAMYKPRNIISSVDDEVGRKTVRDLIPESGHLYPVGRLDWDSEGLILMTNDGDLTNRLTHPRYGHQKEYRVLLARQPDAEQIGTWRRGVVLPDGEKTAPADVYVEGRSGKGAWLRVTMGEGKKRQIRETGTVLGLPVVRIVRIRIGTLHLGSLKPGEWRHLTQGEIDELQGRKVAPMRHASKDKGTQRRPPPKRSGTRATESKPATRRTKR